MKQIERLVGLNKFLLSQFILVFIPQMVSQYWIWIILVFEIDCVVLDFYTLDICMIFSSINFVVELLTLTEVD